MSASNKKKLRKEQEAAILTEKQQKAQAEAKKLKAYTVTFIVVMALVLCIAVGTVLYTSLLNGGVFQRNTVAAKIGNHELNAIDFNYFYVDEITSNYNDWTKSYGDYTPQFVKTMYGLDVSQPLSYQYYDEASGTTWADYFADLTLSNAKTVYSIYDEAIANGYTLSEDAQAAMEDNILVMQDYADLFTEGDADAYVETLYGSGADLESYRKYVEVRSVATAYQADYYNSLVYDDATVDAYNQEHYNDFTAYTFADKYINYGEFLHLNCEDPDSNHEHTDEEVAAAQAAAKEASESLLGATSVTNFDAKISDLDLYAEKLASEVASEKIVDALLMEVNEQLQEWVSDPDRKEGDMTVIENHVTVTHEDGSTTDVLGGYFTLFFQSKDENLRPHANVRHLLVKFEGGETDATTGETTYSLEEKDAAKEEAEALLETWKKGETTDESFAAFVKEHTDDSSTAEIGGLFNDVKKGDNFVENFLNWTIDPERKAGDTGVVESEYGYHIMYYVGDSEETYRDYLITQYLVERDFTEWAETLNAGITGELLNTKYINGDYIIYQGSY